jgi:hypothetical protein
VGGLRSWLVSFSLSSSSGCLTAGEAGIVLSRFRSVMDEAGRPVEVTLPAVPGRAIRGAGVAGVLRTPLGLVMEDRVVVAGRVARLAEVGAALRVAEIVERSEAVLGASDMRLGLAEMPPFLSSTLSSVVELIEVLLRWAAVVLGVVVEVGFRAVLGTVDRTGGLLSDEDVVLRAVDIGATRVAGVEGVDREVMVLVLGAVNGRCAVVVVDFGVAFSSLRRSAMVLMRCNYSLSKATRRTENDRRKAREERSRIGMHITV